MPTIDDTAAATQDPSIVNVTANNALGTIAGGTIVNSGGTIQFDGAFNYTPLEPLTLSGPGANNVGALNKVNGSGTINSPITTIGSSSFGSGTAGSKLTLPNAMNTAVIGDITFTGALEWLDSASNLPNYDYSNLKAQFLLTKRWEF